jgi:hypothetical protein
MSQSLPYFTRLVVSKTLTTDIGEPPQFGRHPMPPVSRKHLAKRGNRGSHPTDRNSHLMNALRVASERGRLIAQDLFKAMAADALERLHDAELRVEIERFAASG